MTTYFDNKLRFFSLLYPLDVLIGAMKDFRSGKLPADRFLESFPFGEFDEQDVARAYGRTRLRGYLARHGASPLALCPRDVLEEQRDMLRSGEIVGGSYGSPLNSLEEVESAIARYDTEEYGKLRRKEFFFWLGVECRTKQQHDRQWELLNHILEEAIRIDDSSILRTYRYFITDDSLTGIAVAGHLLPGTVRLLIGALCLDGTDVSEIAARLAGEFGLAVEAEGLTFARLNTYVRYPYGCHNLIADESAMPALYYYVNVLDVKHRFSSADQAEMLRSLDLGSIVTLRWSS